MFGLNEALMSFIRRQVGLRTDAASSTGSLHAKTGDIKATVIAQANSILAKNLLAYNSAIKSIQRGVITLGASDGGKAATISSVNTSKTMVSFLGVTAPSKGLNNNYAYTGHTLAYLTLTNATTITATRTESQGTVAYVSYEVIEFY